MRKYGWHILAIVTGILAATAVWAWPDRPLWRSGPNVGRLEGFSPDGRWLFTTRNPPRTVDGFPNPEVRSPARWSPAWSPWVVVFGDNTR